MGTLAFLALKRHENRQIFEFRFEIFLSLEKMTSLAKIVEIRQKGLHQQPPKLSMLLAYFHCFYCWQNQTALKDNKNNCSSTLLLTASAGRKAVKKPFLKINIFLYQDPDCRSPQWVTTAAG